MSRRDNADARCARCRVHASLCFCALLPRLETATRVVLVIHRREDRKPTNTGRLACECLANSQILVRGDEGHPEDALSIDPGRAPLLLFPHEGATPLNELARPDPDRPVTLIVPDGNWRQASKVRKRLAGLDGVPCVSLPAGAPSTYRLRSEAHAHGLATLEAIARALGVLEGEHIQRALEQVFDVLVTRTLWARGTIDAADVPGGLPEGARRHDPGAS